MPLSAPKAALASTARRARLPRSCRSVGVAAKLRTPNPASQTHRRSRRSTSHFAGSLHMPVLLNMFFVKDAVGRKPSYGERTILNAVEEANSVLLKDKTRGFSFPPAGKP